MRTTFVRYNIPAIVCLVLLLLVVIPSAARSTVDIRAGLTTAYLRGDNFISDEPDYAVGWTLGASYRIRLASELWLQPEFNLVRKGLSQMYTEMTPSQTFVFDETIRLTTLEVPVLLEFPFPSGLLQGFSLLFGPAAVINLGASAVGSYQSMETSPSLGGDYSDGVDNLIRWDFALVAGIDFRTQIGGWPVIFDLRYNHGLVDPFEDLDPAEWTPEQYFFGDRYVGQGNDVKSRHLSIRIGYALNL